MSENVSDQKEKRQSRNKTTHTHNFPIFICQVHVRSFVFEKTRRIRKKNTFNKRDKHFCCYFYFNQKMSRIISLVGSLLLVGFSFSLVGLLSNQWFIECEPPLATSNKTTTTTTSRLGLWLECRRTNESSSNTTESLRNNDTSKIYHLDWWLLFQHHNATNQQQCHRIDNQQQLPGLDVYEINLLRGLYLVGVVCLTASLLLSVCVRLALSTSCYSSSSLLSTSSCCCYSCCCCKQISDEESFRSSSAASLQLPSNIKPIGCGSSSPDDYQFYRDLTDSITPYKRSCCLFR